MNIAPYPKYVSNWGAWIGSIPDHWLVLRSDFTTESNKQQVSESEMDGIEVVHYSIPNIQEFGSAQIEDGSSIDSSKLRITKAQLLISKLNPRKATICIAEPHEVLLTVCSGEFVPVVNGLDLVLRYCFYVWGSDKVTKLLSSKVQSVTRSHQRCTPEDITKLSWGWPPRVEQQQIAAFLDWKTSQIDALIAKKQELLQKLKEKRLAVITQAVTKGLNPDAPMRDSGIPWLGEVPNHWCVKRLRFSVQRIEQGWSPQCDNQPAEDEAWGVMKVGCVNGDEFDAMENKALPVELEPMPEYELQPKDILISRANTKELLGSAAIVPTDVRQKLLLCDKLFRLRPEAGVDEEFLTCYLRTPAARYQYEREATGSSGSMQNIGQGTLKNLVVVFPPLAEQRSIFQYIRVERSKLDELLDKAQSAITRLTEYRTALITAATTGKIDVRDWQRP